MPKRPKRPLYFAYVVGIGELHPRIAVEPKGRVARRLLETNEGRTITMTSQEVEAERAEAAPERQEDNRQLDYIARYLWSMQRENEVLRERIALMLEAI